MSTEYSYSVSEDTKNGVVSLTRLTNEVYASSIVTNLSYINDAGDSLIIGFDSQLSPEEETTLDSVVANHDGAADYPADSDHQYYRDLIHFIDDGPASELDNNTYREVFPDNSPFPTKVTWWESESKLKKIVEEEVTYNNNKTISTQTWRMYNNEGSLILTVLDTISYNNIFETSRVRSIS